jgi:uncharacterized protein YdaU (DUF1376 family)
MSGRADEWMPLWIGDYLADTMHLTTEQHGAYLLLIMDYWRRGSSPDDDRLLAAIAKISLAKWKILRPILSPFFAVENGRWTHKRIEAERTKALANKDKFAERARTAANARWNAPSNATSIPQAMHEQCPSPSPTIEANASPSYRASRRKTKMALPHDWQPLQPGPTGAAAMIERNWTRERREREIEQFKAHHGSRANVMANWQQAWTNWVLNSEKFGGRSNGNGTSGIGKSAAAFAMLDTSNEEPF